jgi:hypothetical protein
MVIENRLAALEELAKTADRDLHLAVRREHALLRVAQAMVEPTAADEAEEHRLKVEASEAARVERVQAANRSVEIITEEPRPS